MTKQVYKNVGIYLIVRALQKVTLQQRHTPSPLGTPSNLEGEFLAVLCNAVNKRLIPDIFA